jgi:hypothetical protein
LLGVIKLLNSNLMVGMKIKILKTCNSIGETIGDYERQQSPIQLVVENFTRRSHVFSTKETGNYIIGENVELIKLPTKETWRG